MANEIKTSGIADIIASEALATEGIMLLANRDLSPLNHPAILTFTAMNTDSAVVSVPHYGLGGYDLLESVAEGNEVPNTAFSDGSTDVTIAPHAKRYNSSKLAKYVTGEKLGPAALAQDCILAVGRTILKQVAVVGATFTETVETTGVALTWAKVQEAKGKLGVASATGAIMGVFSTNQWANLEANALALGVLPAQTNAGIVNAGLESYKGRYFGIDCYVSEFVPTANAGADHAGCLITAGAIARADAQMPVGAAQNVSDFGVARLQLVDQGTFLSESAVFSYYGGCAKAIDAAGVTIISDAG